jgi:hypothetical protein
MLAVSSHNGETLADTIRIWTLTEKPQLVWEAILYDDYTAALHFGLEDKVLITAGRFLRSWDVSERMRSANFGERMATKFNKDGKQISSLMIEKRLYLKATDLDRASTESPLRDNLRHGNIISRTAIRLWRWCTQQPKNWCC